MSNDNTESKPEERAGKIPLKRLVIPSWPWVAHFFVFVGLWVFFGKIADALGLVTHPGFWMIYGWLICEFSWFVADQVRENFEYKKTV